MAEPFVGEIRMVGFNFAPRAWAFCNGQLLAIAQNAALFALLGTTYGGDGRTTFGLPDLRGRFPTHPGTGPGLSNRRLGERGGVRNVTLTPAQVPMHSHSLNCTDSSGDQSSPEGAFPAAVNSLTIKPYSGESGKSMNSGVLSQHGGNQSHPNEPPYLGINFIIALQGMFPSRN